MNKTELISGVATKLGYTKKDVTAVVDATFAAITDALVNGDKVAVAGFGVFDITERAAREGRNPQTGEAIKIPATKSPKFKASKTLKDAVKGA